MKKVVSIAAVVVLALAVFTTQSEAIIDLAAELGNAIACGDCMMFVKDISIACGDCMFEGLGSVA